jgi:hypothetical protein
MWGVVSMTEKGMYQGVRHFEKYAYLLVFSSVIKAFLSTIQTSRFFTPFFHEALWLDIFIPGIFMVPIKVSVIHFQSKGCSLLKSPDA